MDAPDTDSLPPDQQAMLEAVNAVLLPLARLAVARGVHFGVVQERLKQAFVQAAREANPGQQPHRQVSRVSTTTGINRREVTRLIHGSLQQARPRRPLAAEVHLHWQIDPDYHEAGGAPAVLPRQGAKPSFESLAREITETIDAPTIGIGASAACDGQVLVVNDMLGMFDWTPKFVRTYADLRTEIDRAAAAFASDVKTRRFPAEVETYFSKKPASQ